MFPFPPKVTFGQTLICMIHKTLDRRTFQCQESFPQFHHLLQEITRLATSSYLIVYSDCSSSAVTARESKGFWVIFLTFQIWL